MNHYPKRVVKLLWTKSYHMNNSKFLFEEKSHSLSKLFDASIEAPFFCKFQPNDKNDSGYQHVPYQPAKNLKGVKKFSFTLD